MADKGLPVAPEPWEALAEMVIDSPSTAALTDHGGDDNFPFDGDSSGLGEIDILPEDDSTAASLESVSDELTDDDPSGAGSFKSQAASDYESDNASQSCHPKSHPKKFQTSLSELVNS